MEIIKKEVTIYKVDIPERHPVTSPAHVLTQVFDENFDLIAEHNTNPPTYKWSSMLVFAIWCTSKGLGEGEITIDTLKEWLDLKKIEGRMDN